MKTIEFQQVLPQVFADRNRMDSEVWHRQIAFEKGKKYLVEAASGTGKSSMCSFIYGYRNDYEGIIAFDGRNIRSLGVPQWTALRRRSLSLLFQELRLFPELTAWENVQMKNSLSGGFQSKATLEEWFSRLGLDDRKKQKTGKMSYGQQQRVAFVRALCQPFDFIFLDEPVSHLDGGNAAVMAELLLAEAGRQQAGVVVTSIGNHLPLPYDVRLRL
ncbi:MAG: ATP-binding cassette domain-containing protein [Bacteroidales bacterium]|nr:ATP-binding cassette domain-containing protein [Bacteroidales bacterium]